MTREQCLEEALRNLLAQIDLHTDCMDGTIDSEALYDWVEEAEAVLGYGVTATRMDAEIAERRAIPANLEPAADGVLGDFIGQWINPDHTLPDSDMTVVVNTPNSSEPVWLGFHDGECWRNVEGFPITVTAWAEMPEPIPTQSTQGVT